MAPATPTEEIQPMDYFPVFFDVKQRTCLLVGGGEIATRKGRLLARAGARLRVVAPEISAELRGLVLDKGGEVLQRDYQPEDLDHCILVRSEEHTSELQS